MHKALFLLLLVAGFSCLFGCASGFIYTHIVEPFDLNLDRTANPTEKIMDKGDVKHLQYYIQIEWDTNAIGDIARKKGIENLYYADLETISVLGVWRQDYIHVYGN